MIGARAELTALRTGAGVRACPWRGGQTETAPVARARAIGTIVRPNGRSEIGMSFRLARASGIPMIVIVSRAAAMRCPIASSHPTKTTQMMFR
jgi:hypothetical protein